MDIPNRRHPDCPNVHLGLCSECIRLWRREQSDAKFGDRDDPVDLAPMSEPSSKPSADQGRSARHSASEREQLDAGGQRVEVAGKPDRLEVAKAAVEEGIRKEALSAAEKQKRYREKHGNAYRKREAERQKARRAKIRGSPKSPEE